MMIMMMMNPKKTRNPFLSYFVLFIWGCVLMEVGLGRQNQTTEIKVGVILDLQTTFSKICLTSINMSLSDFYEDHPNYRTRLALHVRDSKEDTVQATASALDLINHEHVSALIGPINSMQAEFMIRLANKSQVPAITFSATSPLLTSIKSSYFVRATVDDSLHVKAIAAIVKSFPWRSVVALYVDNELGEGIMPYLFDALQDVEVQRRAISPEATDDKIRIELLKLMLMQTRIFVVHMASSLSTRVFQIAREIGMMEEGYVWLLTNEMTHMTHDDHGRSLETMQGVLGVRSHVPKSKELEDFRLRWKRKFDKEGDDAELNVFALWAYDSITALAMAVEKTSTKSLRYHSAKASTDLGNIGVSSYGPSLLKALSGVRFKGLAGEFKLIDRQLESSTFEIINFIEKEERIVGVWTPRNGLVNANSNTSRSLSGEKLGQVIWPGKSNVLPRGWEIPTKGKKLRVGVPKKEGFLNFVEVKTDPNSNVTTAKGYSIDIFEAALRQLPYSVIPQYFGLPGDDYNDLVCQVNNGKYDAVVGDITITAQRSSCADFTLPYTESGVSMLVPLSDHENTWVFLKPWRLDLWITTGCFFLLIGFVVWLFEHRVNTDFRGQTHGQIGTSLWFSFSTMVFAHREKVVSNLSRFVVIVWCFVVLVLTQSYTANLTSLLTVQRLRPTAINVEGLIRNRALVGYQDGAFVRDILIKEGFHESQLRRFGCAEECIELFTSGTIVAAFDEGPYLKAILSQNCSNSKYAIVEPTFKTAGFGFAFPKSSPLREDVSRAMLHVTESKDMEGIENTWLNKPSHCPDDPTNADSYRLSLSSFWGLFLIAGIASFLAFLVFVALFLYEHRSTLCDDSKGSVWRKLTSLFRIFNEKDMELHTFKNSAVHNVSSPMTQCTTLSPSTAQTRTWPRSMSLNTEFELRRASLIMGRLHFTTQPKHGGDEQSDIKSEAER